MKRRHFIVGAAGMGGALLVGWGVMPMRSRQGRPALLPLSAGEVPLNGWLKIASDGTVVLASILRCPCWLPKSSTCRLQW
jgi:isoquinoline 1-oxidoreductase beta subunit